jgi:hypothetical protein
MRIIFGTFFIIASFLGAFFFSRYNGAVIVSPLLWYILFIFIGVLGFLLFFGSFKKADRMTRQFEETKILKLKTNSEKIELEFDLCEFKSGSYSHEIKDENISTINLIAPTPISSLHNPTVTENVVRSSLIYNYQISGQTEKYVSQSFPFDQVTLKFYVLKHKISLYVDKFDKRKYFFDLEKLD